MYYLAAAQIESKLVVALLACMTASNKVETCLVNCSKFGIFLVLYVKPGLALNCKHLPRQSVSHLLLALVTPPKASVPKITQFNKRHATNTDHCSETRSVPVKPYINSNKGSPPPCKHLLG